VRRHQKRTSSKQWQRKRADNPARLDSHGFCFAPTGLASAGQEGNRNTSKTVASRTCIVIVLSTSARYTSNKCDCHNHSNNQSKHLIHHYLLILSLLVYYGERGAKEAKEKRRTLEILSSGGAAKSL